MGAHGQSEATKRSSNRTENGKCTNVTNRRSREGLSTPVYTNPLNYKTPDLFWREYSLSHIFRDLIMHNYRSNQSALMTRFGTDLHHQYGIFGSKSQMSFSRNATRAGSEEGRLFSQARQCGTKPFFPLCITYNCFNCSYIYFWQFFF